MNRSPALVFSALLAAPLLAQGETGRTHVDRERGFQIVRPASGWKVQRSNANSVHTLRIHPIGGEGKIEALVRVQAASKGEDAQAVLSKALARIAEDKAYSKLDKLTGKVGGHDAPGVTVRFAGPSDTTYRIEQRYIVANGTRFILQAHAPLAEWKKYEAAFRAIHRSFALVEVGAKAKTARRLAALAARCGSEIEWAQSWRDAATRAKKEEKLVLVQVRSYRGFDLPDVTKATLYMDPDIVELIGHRFIAFRYQHSMPAPFRAQKSYGMSPSTFGQAVMLVTPDGKVLRETSSIHPSSVYDFLVDGLRRFAAGDSEGPQAGVNLAAWNLEQGRLDRVERYLEKETGAKAHRLRATLYRRLRRGSEALAHLAKARASGDTSMSVAVEEAVVHLRMNRPRAARETLARLRKSNRAARDTPEVLFWTGICDTLVRRKTTAAETWKKLMDDHGDSRWAWQAAALALGRAGVKIAWPEESVLATLRSPDRKPLKVDEVVKAEADGLAFLFDHQRDDGSWLSPGEVLRVGAKTPHPFTEAVTAICGRAMLQRSKTAGCREAAGRALTFLLNSHELVKKHPHPRSYMDYTVWSNAFVLSFLADCNAAGLGDAETIARVSLELVADLVKKQKPTGGWSYYVTGDLKSSAASTQSISFTTAPVLLALLRARDEGIEVRESVIEAAIRCLQKMRSISGVFAYFLFEKGRGGSTGKPGAAGRGPACELALLRAGQSSAARMKNAVEIFTKYRKGLAKEVGKVLMHAGPDGQGCHYPMFDYAFAASAIRTMPKQERAPHREKLLELILATRSVEGAFRDTQFNGWEYGTGMALWALHALRED